MLDKDLFNNANSKKQSEVNIKTINKFDKSGKANNNYDVKKFVLVGNPNVGKTTIFNALTNKNEKTGNWHGVTVDKKVGKIKDTDFFLVDLPGIYSINSYSLEEKVAEDFIKTNPNAIYLSIIESSNFNRSIDLSLSLIKRNLKVILIFNMYDEILKNNGKIDVVGLTKLLSTPIITINANDKNDIKKLKDFLVACKNVKAETNSNNQIIKPDKQKCLNFFTQPKFKESFLDKILLNGFFCMISFLLVIFAIFTLTFAKNMPGDMLLSCFEKLKSYLVNNLLFFLENNGCPNVIKSFIIEGILNGVFHIICFLPQLSLMYLCLTFLEESGYMSRVAFHLDGIFSKIGLNGRAVFSIILGFGCTTVGILSTKSLDNKNLQKKTIFALPFISCSAKLPIYLVIINAFFARNKTLILTLVYLFGIILSTITAYVLNKFVYKDKKTFIMEMPILRFVNIKRLLKILINYIKQFIIKVGTSIFFIMIILWFAKNFSFTLTYLGETNLENSIIAFFGNIIKYLFYPIGVYDWQTCVSLLSGLFAKEVIVSSLDLFYPNGISGIFNSVSAISLLTFIMFYTPCFSALATMKRQVGLKLTAYLAVFQFMLALLLAFIVGILAKLSIIINIWWLIFTLFVIIIISVIKRLKKSIKCKNCGLCDKGKL